MRPKALQDCFAGAFLLITVARKIPQNLLCFGGKATSLFPPIVPIRPCYLFRGAEGGILLSVSC